MYALFHSAWRLSVWLKCAFTHINLSSVRRRHTRVYASTNEINKIESKFSSLKNKKKKEGRRGGREFRLYSFHIFFFLSFFLSIVPLLPFIPFNFYFALACRTAYDCVRMFVSTSSSLAVFKIEKCFGFYRLLHLLRVLTCLNLLNSQEGEYINSSLKFGVQDWTLI